MLSLSPNGVKGDFMRIRSIRDIAAAARGRRLDLGLNQADLARRVGVSRKWLVEFEAGKQSAELGLVLRVLDELGLLLDLSPEGEGQSSTGETVDLDALLEEHRQR
jgi:HTH-type transcriptional regulator/antitoxin HipB